MYNKNNLNKVMFFEMPRGWIVSRERVTLKIVATTSVKFYLMKVFAINHESFFCATKKKKNARKNE
jgi:hypothetical protein